MFDSTSQKYVALKQDNAASNFLSFRFTDALYQIPTATYSSLWKQNEENILIMSGTTGNTSAWFNGVKVVDADATAWTEVDSAVVTIGANINGLLNFDGEIHYFKTWNRILTAAEIAALSADRITKIA